jgi:hypothetical protein
VHGVELVRRYLRKCRLVGAHTDHELVTAFTALIRRRVPEVSHRDSP